MSYLLDAELRQYFPSTTSSHAPAAAASAASPPAAQQLSDHELRALASAALTDDPALAYMLRMDSVLEVRRGVVTCLATVRRNVHQYELVYLQRFKQISEPAIRHPKSKDQVLMCLDPKALKCGQRLLLKVHARGHPAEPMRLLRECAILRSTSSREPSFFPKAYLFGCLGNHCWRVASNDRADSRQVVVHRQHFLLCQHVEDSLQRIIDANRSAGEGLQWSAAARTCKDMVNRIRHLHSIGWVHGDLRPACFVLVGGGDEILLSDFASAAPIGQQGCCLTFNACDGGGGAYEAARFRSNATPHEAVFGDFEGLFYILCGLVSARPLPWEDADAALAQQHKRAVWQFVEEADDSTADRKDADDADDGAISDADGSKLWQTWRLGDLFNCTQEDVDEHPAFRLASAIARLHRFAYASPTGAAGKPSAARAANYYCSALIDSLR